MLTQAKLPNQPKATNPEPRTLEAHRINSVNKIRSIKCPGGLGTQLYFLCIGTLMLQTRGDKLRSKRVKQSKKEDSETINDTVSSRGCNNKSLKKIRWSSSC